MFRVDLEETDYLCVGLQGIGLIVSVAEMASRQNLWSCMICLEANIALMSRKVSVLRSD
jgi:hypothetical protein